MTQRLSGTRVALLLAVGWAAAVVQPLGAQILAFEPVGTLPGPVDLVESTDQRAYVAADKTLTIYDISDPSAPTRLGDHTFPEKI